MKEIQLTQGKVALVDDEDYERISAHKWFYSNQGYAVRIKDKKIFLMHREVLNVQPGMFTDHVNGNGLDNRRENLRPCTYIQNKWNSKKRSDSKYPYKGIEVHRNKWRAIIKVEKRKVYLGSFKNPVDAARAYDAAARKYFGEFARTNFAEGD